jgi:hypothetical protein
MIQRKRLHDGPEKRRSLRYDKRFQVTLEFEGGIYEVRTIDISRHGVLIPRRLPPPVGTSVKLTLRIRDEISTFEGEVKRHTRCLVNGVQTTGIGIDFASSEYEEFVKDKILIT